MNEQHNLYKLIFSQNDDKDNINNLLVIYVDHQKIDKDEVFVKPGIHHIEMRQFHFLNNIYFLFGAIFMAIVLVFSTDPDVVFLVRRWGRFSVTKFEIEVYEDQDIIVNIEKKKIRFMSEKYLINVISNQVEKVELYERRSFFALLGTITLISLPLAIIALIIWLVN